MLLLGALRVACARVAAPAREEFETEPIVVYDLGSGTFGAPTGSRASARTTSGPDVGGIDRGVTGECQGDTVMIMSVRVVVEDPVLAALAHAPVGEPLPPELEAEYERREADVIAGKARMRSLEDVSKGIAALRDG